MATCFGLQHLALQQSGGRFTKCESNFFSSIGRIQAGASAKPEIMALGSSLTGRLPDRAQGYNKLSNMGADGGSAVDSLRAIDRGILPTPKWIIIEANKLERAVRATHSDIYSAMESGWFRVGMQFPLLSSYARPSAYFYSKLLARKIGSASRNFAEEGFKPSQPPTPPSQLPNVLPTDPAELRIATEIGSILSRLEKQGTRSLIVWLPRGRGDEPIPNWILYAAKSGNAYWWDYAATFPADLVRYTDAAHMDATSATRTTGDLIRAVEQLER